MPAQLLAPVAANTRRSPAVSLRTNPTDMARTARAKPMPKAVAPIDERRHARDIVLGFDGHTLRHGHQLRAFDLSRVNGLRCLDEPTGEAGLEPELLYGVKGDQSIGRARCRRGGCAALG